MKRRSLPAPKSELAGLVCRWDPCVSVGPEPPAKRRIGFMEDFPDSGPMMLKTCQFQLTQNLFLREIFASSPIDVDWLKMGCITALVLEVALSPRCVDRTHVVCQN